jgi:hypothetical protein
MMEQSAEHWIHIHNVRGHKETIRQTAKKYAREIAERLVKELTE